MMDVEIDKWYSINECLNQLRSDEKLMGVFIIKFDESREVKFAQNSDKHFSSVSCNKLEDHYKKTDKEVLLIASSNNMYQSISDYSKLSKEEIPPDLEPKSAKVLWQIVDRANLKVSFFETNNPIVKKKELLSKFKAVPLGNKSFNDNDAIPTWSGFNYQGKCVIFRAITKINALWDDGTSETEVKKILDNYSIEIELKEDFVLYERDIPVEYIQVKAALASRTFSNYSKAIKQLLDHRNEGANPSTAECILMSAIPVGNWKAECPVKLYDSIQLLEIPKKIKEELAKLLAKIGEPTDKFTIKVVYENLCGLLDQRVSNIHENKSSYHLNLNQDFWKSIRTSINEKEESAIFSTYEILYLSVCENLVEVIESRCDECRNGYSQYDCDTCSIPSLRDNFLATNLIDYIPILNPDQILHLEKIDHLKKLVETFSKKEIKNLLYQFEFSYVDDYCWNPAYHMLDMGRENYIIPTLLDFGSEKFGKSIAIRLSNIINNVEIYSAIQGKALTAIKPEGPILESVMENNVTNYKEIKKRFLPEESSNSKEGNQNINVSENDIKIIDRASFVNELREKSDKCE
ncbi:hypothetical protein JZO70_14065 [Enterococcus sp. 669A]|uniref:Uncharacterized protein n=1 Tax=Candidatus Enterococcus moelleringii TaxID=2815325 RepID=A0ABS3LCE5_9ENTE|nr:ABC-three component system protein [Enterococcus sp. 669A]MBO1307299.1 hypothetical protein [Enterococcus sp. 669A]